MATAADAELIIKLYELRREEKLRQARHFMIFEFNPKNLEDLRAVSRDLASTNNAFWRQATSYWEMAASFVVSGALNADLFLDSSAEGILIYAKFHHFHVATEKESGNPFMKQTATLVQTHPGAKALYEQFQTMFPPPK